MLNQAKSKVRQDFVLSWLKHYCHYCLNQRKQFLRRQNLIHWSQNTRWHQCQRMTKPNQTKRWTVFADLAGASPLHSGLIWHWKVITEPSRGFATAPPELPLSSVHLSCSGEHHHLNYIHISHTSWLAYRRFYQCYWNLMSIPNIDLIPIQFYIYWFVYL